MNFLCFQGWTPEENTNASYEEFGSKTLYKSIFVYSRKMQSKFEIYWEMYLIFLIFWLIKSRWFEQLGYNLADL
jgi:hypothetical protein